MLGAFLGTVQDSSPRRLLAQVEVSQKKLSRYQVAGPLAAVARDDHSDDFFAGLGDELQRHSPPWRGFRDWLRGGDEPLRRTHDDPDAFASPELFGSDFRLQGVG